jgi:hypothetical protein
VPCARRRLDAIARLAARAGLNLVEASVSDPDPITAIGDALADWPAQQLLVRASRGRLRAPYPFDLWTRAHRLSGLPIGPR